jgi:hypothetical protein
VYVIFPVSPSSAKETLPERGRPALGILRSNGHIIRCLIALNGNLVGQIPGVLCISTIGRDGNGGLDLVFVPGMQVHLSILVADAQVGTTLYIECFDDVSFKRHAHRLIHSGNCYRDTKQPVQDYLKDPSNHFIVFVRFNSMELYCIKWSFSYFFCKAFSSK